MIYELSLVLPLIVAHRLCRVNGGRVRKEELDNVLAEMEEKLKSMIGIKVPLRGYERVPFFLEYFEVMEGVIEPKYDEERMEKTVRWHIDSLAYVDKAAAKVIVELLKSLE